MNYVLASERNVKTIVFFLMDIRKLYNLCELDKFHQDLKTCDKSDGTIRKISLTSSFKAYYMHSLKYTDYGNKLPGTAWDKPTTSAMLLAELAMDSQRGRQRKLALISQSLH